MGTGRSLPVDEPDEIRKMRISNSFNIRERIESKRTLLSQILARAASQQDDEPSQIPKTAMGELMQYLLPQLGTLLSVSSSWYLMVHEAVDNLMAQAENSFVTMHSQLILFKRSYTVARGYSISDNVGVRIDRVIQAEPLRCLIGKSIRMRYTYSYRDDPATYKAEFRFDWIKRGKKTVWAHKDESKVHGQSITQAYTRQISQTCAEDLIEFVINIYNLEGFVDLESITWTLPEIDDTKPIVNHIDKIIKNPPTNVSSPDMEYYKMMLVVSKQRTWEVEHSQTEWYDWKYYSRPDDIRFIQSFSPFLKLERVEFAGVDLTIAKITYKAFLPGIIPDSAAKIGLTIEVKQNDQLRDEVKRVGFLIDRDSVIQLREGDTFILYISRN